MMLPSFSCHECVSLAICRSRLLECKKSYPGCITKPVFISIIDQCSIVNSKVNYFLNHDGRSYIDPKFTIASHIQDEILNYKLEEK